MRAAVFRNLILCSINAKYSVEHLLDQLDKNLELCINYEYTRQEQLAELAKMSGALHVIWYSLERAINDVEMGPNSSEMKMMIDFWEDCLHKIESQWNEAKNPKYVKLFHWKPVFREFLPGEFLDTNKKFVFLV